jgi:uncharacterized protein
MKKMNKILLVLISCFYIFVFNVQTAINQKQEATSVKKTSYGLLIETEYGDVQLNKEVQLDKILIEIIEHPAFTRMYGIHQYGTTHYVTEQLEESPYKGNIQQNYTRWEHSLGVFVLLRRYNAHPLEQIAGLLHDISHTGFSHVGDFLFKSQTDSSQTAFQDTTQKSFLEKSGIRNILEKNGINLESVLIDKFKNLKQAAPEICADNLEYTLKGGLLAGYLSLQEIQFILKNLTLNQNLNRWAFLDELAAFKFGMASLTISEKNSGSVWNAVLYTITAKIINRAFNMGILSSENFLTTTNSLKDDNIFNTLKDCTESKIHAYMGCLSNFKKVYDVLEFQQNDSIPVQTKFRGTNPWILKNNDYKKLTDINNNFQQAYSTIKTKHENGNFIRFKNGFKILFHKITKITGQ